MVGKVADAVQQLVEPQCIELGFELVDVEYVKQSGRYLLRLYIDKPGGITLEDCEQLSRRIDPLLDEHDPVPGSYYLEVSSPGLDRPLKRESDFTRFTGEKIRIKTFTPINDSRSFTGVLLGYNNGNVLLQQDTAELTIPLNQIAKANLVPTV